MNWDNVSLVVLGLTAFVSAFGVALWVSLVIWTFRDMRSRTRDAFAQLLASLMVLVLGPLGAILYLILRPRESLSDKYERSLEEEALLQDIEERQICPGCKQPIEPDYVLCPVCHTRLRHPCTHCGRLIHPRWSICPYCAESQRPVPGAESVGRVTLRDLENEEIEMGSEVPAASEVGEIAELEQAAMRSVADTEFAAPLTVEWEPGLGEVQEQEAEPLAMAWDLKPGDEPEQEAEPQELDDFAELLSLVDEAAERDAAAGPSVDAAPVAAEDAFEDVLDVEQEQSGFYVFKNNLCDIAELLLFFADVVAPA